MKQVLTLVCKLNPSKKVTQKIESTLEAFSNACNYANQNVKPSITSKTTIQSQVYQTIREIYSLSANLAVRACARVGANRKTAKQKKRTVKEFKPTSAQLCKHRDGNYYIHIQIKDDAPKPLNSDNVIGVDFGRTDLAVTSDGKKWSGKEIRDVRDKYFCVRASGQKRASKGTRFSRRRCRQILKRLSGRERRFQRHVNHVISKTIIKNAKKSNSLVAIEDLTGIRDRTNQQPRSKTERRRSNSWAFFQLWTFLEYKGLINGVQVIPVTPRYSSQTCREVGKDLGVLIVTVVGMVTLMKMQAMSC